MIDRTQPVADLVLQHSECAEVFQRNRIDFCCRGEMPIEEAAKARSLDVDKLVGELEAAVASSASRGGQGIDPQALSTGALTEYIVSKHHEYLRRTLPFVQMLANKVQRVHGDHNPKLRDLAVVVNELVDSLLPHMDDEEQTLFPTLGDKASDKTKLRDLLDAMYAEHLEVSELLTRARAATDDYAVPDWGCNSYRTLFSELEKVEKDLFTHVHLENHVLRPRGMASSAPSA